MALDTMPLDSKTGSSEFACLFVFSNSFLVYSTGKLMKLNCLWARNGMCIIDNADSWRKLKINLSTCVLQKWVWQEDRATPDKLQTPLSAFSINWRIGLNHLSFAFFPFLSLVCGIFCMLWQALCWLKGKLYTVDRVTVTIANLLSHEHWTTHC